MWAAWSCTNPHQSQETMETAVNMKVFSVSHWVREIIGSGKGGSIWPGATSGSIWVGFYPGIGALHQTRQFYSTNVPSLPARIHFWMCPGWAQLRPGPPKGVALFWFILGGKLRPCDAHGGASHIESGATWKNFTPSWAQRRHNMGNIDRHEASSMPNKSWKYRWKRAFWGFCLGPPKRVQLGAKLHNVGAKVGAKWVQVGRSCWPKLTPSGADRNGAFGRCFADMQNAQITTPGEHGPPSWSCTSLTDLSGRIHCLATFGVGWF